MIIYGAVILSLLVTLGFFLTNKKAYTWWEFFIPTTATAIVAIVFKLIFSAVGENFSEYWGSTIVSVYEQEPYNYWKVEICSREVPCGTDSEGNTEYCTEYYDCSHQEDVGPSWYAETNIGESFYIRESQYDSLVIQFGGTRNVYNEHKNYSPRDRAVGSRGTKFEGKRVGNVSYVWQANWPGTDETRKAAFSKHRYVNKIKASDLTIFNIKVVSEKQADTLGLFQYPDMDRMWFPTILTDSGVVVSKDIKEKFRRLNGKYGPTNEMRLWVLVYQDKPELYGEYQKNYWVKGNMNELVVCMSVKDTTLQWVNVFSWTTNESLPIEIRDYISNLPSINEKTWNDMYVYFNDNLPKFQRRDFKEFDYLKRQNRWWEILIVYIFGVAAAVGLNFWVSTNEFDDENPKGYSSYNYYNHYRS